MRIGVVKWFNKEKGYGLIEDDGGHPVFLHHSEIRGRQPRVLDRGQKVTFEVVEGEGRSRAENVVVVLN